MPEDIEARDYLEIKQKAGKIMLLDIDIDIINRDPMAIPMISYGP